MFTKLPSELVKIDNKDSIILSYNLRTAEIFDSFEELYHTVNNQPVQCFYEVLSENKKRKMYFDIDIEDKTKLNIDEFIKHVSEVILQILPDCLMLITLSENDIVKKCGIHIIIVNYYADNVYKAKRFYYTVYNNINQEYRCHFDDKVYKSVQQFRLLFSSKMNENRPKKYKEMIPKLNVSITKKELLKMSMLSIIENACPIPDDTLYYIEKVEYNDDVMETIDSTEALKVLKKATKLMDLSSFSYKNVKGIFIILKRIKPSRCVNCNRIHENENAFLYLKNNDIFFGCRRSSKNKNIGSYLDLVEEDFEKELLKVDVPIVKNKEEEFEKALLSYFS